MKIYTIKSVILYGNRRIEISDLPLKRLKYNQVLIEIKAAGICGSDLHILNSGAHSPHVAGHEIAGITSDGTHVAIEPIISCRKCKSCESGDYHLCKVDFQGIGMSINGGMAEQILVPEECLIKLDKRVAIEDACLVEPLAVALHGFIRTNTTSDNNKNCRTIGSFTN